MPGSGHTHMYISSSEFQRYIRGLEGGRTLDLLLRRQTLYPLSYEPKHTLSVYTRATRVYTQIPCAHKNTRTGRKAQCTAYITPSTSTLTIVYEHVQHVDPKYLQYRSIPAASHAPHP